MSFENDFVISELRSRLESLLLVVEEPASPALLARILGVAEAEILALLIEISTELDARGSGIELREITGGWRFYTRKRHAGDVEKLILDGQQSRLSKAALETLAVVAYRQPVTRSQVAAVRGVNVDGVMRSLQLRGLIREVPSDENNEVTGGARRYATTELFLEVLGIESLEALPELAPLLPDLDSIDISEA
ncbi:SMC-Scp complex subunit ScpB [Corynebacterium caspium]|uniref:SMC-Scp complex subunit ScpB n=1 Tax=Corynebacterium caspium TaxID=234828 RepID=UPI00036FC27D|nr:SMC-Scp complex subunit ScpB [Corynebacterium caspium]WKD59343.1 Segregation and condensation protein B [Corynebacterium caspium DSM 44850]